MLLFRKLWKSFDIALIVLDILLKPSSRYTSKAIQLIEIPSL